MRKRLRYAFVPFLAFALAACGMQAPDSSGLWTGELTGPGGVIPITLSLTQQDSQVSGTLTFELPQAPAGLPMSGTIIGSQLTLSAGTTARVDLSATVNGNSMTGAATYSGPEGISSLQLSATR